ncbi:MAG: 3-methyl-2-oxobutanoate hydroxymethyltransferase [Leptolyngbyaceae cyanobacterium CRU_2_3]|nr:3-methyl-2-oxobutanoate hydroxymethyltransferase [Leptolyngbyaceae cyanobacterium CRU_2_3]
MAVTTQHLIRYKKEGRLIAALTAWDYLTAQAIDQAGVDLIMVGDSLAMVALGYDTTLPLTLDEIIHHAKAVRRGIQKALMVVDLPFMTYQESPEQAMRSAGRVMKETGAQAVKLEGGYPAMAETVARLVQAGIPVMGHIGLTPQSVHQFGGFRQQGKSAVAAERILEEAIALEQAGAFSLVLEHIPADLALRISQKLTIPTIGIGAGAHCDGQVLVTADLLGLSSWSPPFAKTYTNLRETIFQAVQTYCTDVKEQRFPEAE